MDLEGAKDEFAVRYYRWAREDFRREIGQGFPLLGSIKGTAALRLLAAMESLGPDEQVRFADALVKRFHPRATELLNEPLTG
jgi:hypothetical protein